MINSNYSGPKVPALLVTNQEKGIKEKLRALFNVLRSVQLHYSDYNNSNEYV